LSDYLKILDLARDTAFEGEEWGPEAALVDPGATPADTFLHMLGKETRPVKNDAIHFGSITPLSDRDALTNAYTAADGSMVVDNINSWRVGETFVPRDGGTHVEFYCSAVTTGTSTITVAAKSGTDRDIAAGASLLRLGCHGEDGQVYTLAASSEGTEYTTYLAFLQTAYSISNRKAVQKLFMTGEDVVKMEIRKKVIEHAKSRANILYFGKTATWTGAANSKKVTSTMGALDLLKTYGSSSGSHITNWGFSQVSRTIMEEFWDHSSRVKAEGTDTKLVFCGPDWMRFFQDILLKYGESVLKAGKNDFGFQMMMWHTAYGCDFAIHSDPVLRPATTAEGSDLFVIDLNAIQPVAFDGVNGVEDVLELNTNLPNTDAQTGVFLSSIAYDWGAPDYNAVFEGMDSWLIN